jgi:hypothetical protein
MFFFCGETKKMVGNMSMAKNEKNIKIRQKLGFQNDR